KMDYARGSPHRRPRARSARAHGGDSAIDRLRRRRRRHHRTPRSGACISLSGTPRTRLDLRSPAVHTRHAKLRRRSDAASGPVARMMLAASFLGGAKSRLLPASIPFRFFGAAAIFHVLTWLALLAGSDY